MVHVQPKRRVFSHRFTSKQNECSSDQSAVHPMRSAEENRKVRGASLVGWARYNPQLPMDFQSFMEVITPSITGSGAHLLGMMKSVIVGGIKQRQQKCLRDILSDKFRHHASFGFGGNTTLEVKDR